MNTITIWTPINSKSGFGHFYRMLGIYEQLRDNHIPTTYFTNEDYIQIEPVDILHLNSKNIVDIADYLLKNKISTLLIDNYSVSIDNLEYLMNHFTVFFVDSKVENPKVDAILNFNPYSKNQYTTKHKKSRYFLGLEYMVFRKKLQNTKISQTIKNTIFISIGGSDTSHTTLKLIRYLPTNFTYHIVLGKGCSKEYLDTVSKNLKKENLTHHLYIQPQNYFEIMSRCEFVICSCSTTTYEVSYFKKPFLCIKVVENQNKITEYLKNQGISIFEKEDLSHIYNAIKNKQFSILKHQNIKSHQNQLFKTLIKPKENHHEG